MAAGRRTGEDRILTVPTAFTLLRLACIPVFVVLLAEGRHRWFEAALLLGAIGATDWVDGQLARRLHQVSTLGKVLDPLADRLLLVVSALAIIAVGAVPVWLAVLFLTREVLVAGGFLLVVALGGKRMDVVWAGKAGTFGLMTTLPLFLLGHAEVSWHRIPEVLAWVSTVGTLAFGWYAVVVYVRAVPRALAEGRAGHRSDPPAG
ncbi:MAG: CDP-alcohol phosphatidyltransferase family protein [Acidimicrobiaceae bacterium]|nr:CDP-alcohol phosphatidyltransferase family protein [Acidimicrobiaceae bacterium]